MTEPQPTPQQLSDMVFATTGIRWDPDYYRLMLEDWWAMRHVYHPANPIDDRIVLP